MKDFKKHDILFAVSIAFLALFGFAYGIQYMFVSGFCLGLFAGLSIAWLLVNRLKNMEGTK